MDFGRTVDAGTAVPNWVPNGVKLYLRHTGGGESLRTLARETGCHASTVMRQVRRFENQRDDPLIDEALDVLTNAIETTPANDPSEDDIEKRNCHMNMQLRSARLPDEDTLNREARRILRRLSETGAVLALAVDMDKAVVLREGPDGPPTRTAIVPRDVAQAFAVKDWISCSKNGRISTYQITQAGRAALKRLLAEDAAKRNRSGAGNLHAEQHRDWAERNVMIGGDDEVQPIRVNAAESPLTMLARRKDGSGRPFLDQELVQAGERFREDFEMSQMGPRVAQNWDRFLTSGDRSAFDGADVNEGPRAARERVLEAMTDLGPGLGDIIMRCCCFLEGLEAAEKRMGWSARSGKVVLRIALQRLRRHYVEKHGSVTAMLG